MFFFVNSFVYKDTSKKNFHRLEQFFFLDLLELFFLNLADVQRMFNGCVGNGGGVVVVMVDIFLMFSNLVYNLQPFFC